MSMSMQSSEVFFMRDETSGCPLRFRCMMNHSTTSIITPITTELMPWP